MLPGNHKRLACRFRAGFCACACALLAAASAALAQGQQTATASGGSCPIAVAAGQGARVTILINGCNSTTVKIVKQLAEKANTQENRLQRLEKENTAATAQIRNLAAAVEYLRQESASKDASAIVRQAQAKLEQGDPTDAIFYLGQQAAKSGQQSAQLFRYQAGLLTVVDHQAALNAMEKALAIEPENVADLALAAALAASIKNLDRANDLYLKLLNAADKPPGVSISLLKNGRLVRTAREGLAEVARARGDTKSVVTNLLAAAAMPAPSDSTAKQQADWIERKLGIYIGLSEDSPQAMQESVSTIYNDRNQIFFEDDWHHLTTAEEDAQAYVVNAAWLNRIARASTDWEGFLDLVDEQPFEATTAAKAAALRVGYGDIHLARGRLSDALSRYEKAEIVRLKLVNIFPSEIRYRWDLARTLSRIGDVKLARGKVDAALDAYQRSLLIRQRIAAVSSENGEVLLGVAMLHERIGDTLGVMKLPGQAWDEYMTALRVREQVAKLEPTNPDVQYSLAISSMKLGLLNLTTKTMAERRQLLTQSLATLEAVRIQDRVAITPTKELIARVQNALSTIERSAQ